jgi:hypothetical protein
METYKFLIPGKLIPSLKKAARDVKIDILSTKPEELEGYYTVELIAYSPFALINMGMIMGMDSALCIFNEPLTNKE